MAIKKIKKIKKVITPDIKQLRLEILQKMSDLVTAGLGLVAALAWNEAIKAFFSLFFPQPGGNIAALTLYALLITIVIVVITFQLGRAVNLAKKSVEVKGKKQC
jgi:hypothetical protein